LVVRIINYIYLWQERRNIPMEKELYTAPEMEIVKFDSEDVITTSGGIDEIEVPDPFG